MITYRSIDRADCREAASLISNGFSWASSPEGSAFWRAVQERLQALGDGDSTFTGHCIPALRPSAPSLLPSPHLSSAMSAEISGLKNQVANLEAGIAALTAERDNQAKTIVELRRQLRLEGFMNMGR